MTQLKHTLEFQAGVKASATPHNVQAVLVLYRAERGMSLS